MAEEDAHHSKRVIILSIDASKQAEDAVKWYYAFLHRPENRVLLVNIPEGATVESTKGQKVNDGEVQRLAEREKKLTEALQGKFDGVQQELNVHGEYLTVYGRPGEALVTAAQEHKAGMIIMGTRGLGTIRRTILGSVSDYVVHHAHCPVIVCRQ